MRHRERETSHSACQARETSGKKFCVRMQGLRPDATYATETSRRSGRNLAIVCARTTHVSAHAAPNDACHGICLPNEECQGISLLDAECQGKWDPDEAYDGAPPGNRAVTMVAYRRDCQSTVHSIKHAFGSRHCDSIQFYSLHILYIYIPHLA